jgi:hypothetical protein
MAAKKKKTGKTTKKGATRASPKKRVATKAKPKPKPVKRAVAPTPKKKRAKVASKRTPPMHQTVSHPELEDEAHEEVFEIFKAYDRDGSGSIDRGEFARLLEALGQNPSELELSIALDVVDANHSGRISWDEFKAWWSSR